MSDKKNSQQTGTYWALSYRIFFNKYIYFRFSSPWQHCSTLWTRRARTKCSTHTITYMPLCLLLYSIYVSLVQYMHSLHTCTPTHNGAASQYNKKASYRKQIAWHQHSRSNV